MTQGKNIPVNLSSFSDLAPELIEVMVSVACDIALILDDNGVIQNVAVGQTRPPPADAREWIGQHWADTVTVEMRDKVGQFLADLSGSGVSRVRHLAHVADEGPEIPMAYSAIRLGDQGPTLAVGRDMRLVSAMQERLTNTQRTMERDYWQRRQAETRYRLLFDVASEPMLIIDAATYDVVDANRSAVALLGRSGSDIVGKPLGHSVAASARASLYDFLDGARAGTLPLSGRTTTIDAGKPLEVGVTSFDGESSNVFFLRLREVVEEIIPPADASTPDAKKNRRLEALFERSADVIAVCDLKGRLLFVNEAFLNLAELSREQAVAGRNLLDWLSSGGVTEILGMVKNDERSRLFTATFKRSNDAPITVEMSATLLKQQECVGLIIRVCHAQATTAESGESGRDIH